MKLKVTLFEPGHPAGNPLHWFWTVESAKEVVDCGKHIVMDGAIEEAQMAYMREKDALYVEGDKTGAPLSEDQIARNNGVSSYRNRL